MPYDPLFDDPEYRGHGDVDIIADKAVGCLLSFLLTPEFLPIWIFILIVFCIIIGTATGK